MRKNLVSTRYKAPAPEILGTEIKDNYRKYSAGLQKCRKKSFILSPRLQSVKMRLEK